MSRPTLRVLAVLELLQARGRQSGTALAAELGVDGRTVRRYIRTLEALGIPITAEQGRDGGYQLLAGFKLPPMMFTADEALSLSVGLLAARGLGLAEAAPAAASAQAKLERVMPQGLCERLRAVGETVSLELTRPASRFDNAVLLTLSAAARQRQRVHLAYRTPQGAESARDFDPYGLVCRAGSWYVAGHCHLRRALRSFRLDRVLTVQLMPMYFERPPSFDALHFLKDSIATLPRAHAVEVRLDTDLASAQRALFSAIGLLEWRDEAAGGGVLLRSQADDLDWFARELSRLPFGFEILKPRALCKVLAAHAERLQQQAKSSRAMTGQAGERRAPTRLGAWP